jgi:hypothetical protein
MDTTLVDRRKCTEENNRMGGPQKRTAIFTDGVFKGWHLEKLSDMQMMEFLIPFLSER